jgi:hypothetical protein
MFSRVVGYSVADGLTLEAELDPASEAFLQDHALNGVPLLPGVMGIEGFAVAAQHIASILGSEGGGFRVSRLEEIHFLAPFKFHRHQPRRITWKAQAVRQGRGLAVTVRLESTPLVLGQAAETVQHFRGKVYLQPVATPLTAAHVTPPYWNGAYTVPAADIYHLYFHGPTFQVLAGVQRAGAQVLGKMRMDLPPIVSQAEGLTTAPLLLELALQTAGIWEAGETGVLALPRAIGQMTLHHLTPSDSPIYAEVTPGAAFDGARCFNARVVDAAGRVYLELQDYQTSPLPYRVAAELLAPLRPLVDG